jgi:cobalt-zinc-cadmium efflux system outer membrane protein
MVLAIAASVGGCGGGSGDGGFASVQGLSRDRIGQQVQWERSYGDSAPVAAKVGQLLDHPLTADSAVQVALLNNHGLQATFEDLGIAQADLVQAGLLKNPVLDLSIRFPDRPPGKTYLDFSAAENLLDVFLIPARNKLAAAELAEVQARVADEVFDLAAKTASAYYTCQGTQQIVTIRQTALDASEAAMASADRLHQAGNIPELTYLNERAQADRAKLELADAISASEDARTQLELLMGIAGSGVQWTIADDLSAPPAGTVAVNELQRQALRQREDLLAARNAVIVAARAFGLTENQRFFDDTDALALGPEAERETDGQWRIGPTLSLPIPLFDQGQARLAKSEAMFRQSCQRYALLAVEICAQVRMSANHLQRFQAEAALYHDEILPTQQRLLDATLRHYNGMYASVFDLLAAKRDQLDASERYVSALQAYWIAHADVERAVGGRIPLPTATTQPSTQSSTGERP